jgi:ribosomal protein L7/L12
MSDGIDLLDISALREEIDALLCGDGRPRPSGPRETEAILEDARQLLLRLSDAPEIVEAGMDWQAVRLTPPNGDRMITCWNEGEHATLIGEWTQGILSTWIVEVGEQYWAARETRHGQSRLSHDDEVAGPADRRPFADLERRSREELERWTRKHPPQERWACANCDWQNDPEDATCRVCDLPASNRAITFERRPTIDEEFSTLDVASQSNEMTLPPGMEDILRSVASAAKSVPATPRFEVVLLGFPPASRTAIVEAVRKTLHASTADAETLLATMPARIIGGLSVTKARDLSEKLESLGASIEIRKNRA